MDMETALAQLGVLDEMPGTDTRDQLDRDGFTQLREVLSAAQLEAFRIRLAELTEAEAERAGAEVHQEPGIEWLWDLINKDLMFDICFTHPRVLAAIRHVLGEFQQAMLVSRTVLPGYGDQALHVDAAAPVAAGQYHICNTIWLLDDFTPDNGATRVVPGSHRSGKLPTEAMHDTVSQHPREKLLLGPAGTVVVFNGHLWHAGTTNCTDRPRRALYSLFTNRGTTQLSGHSSQQSSDGPGQLSVAARFILGI